MARPRKFDEDEALEAAMQTFWTQGYAATTSRQLSDSMGIAPASLYNAFGDKHAVYLRALQRYYEHGTAGQLEILQGPGSAKDRVRALMTWVIDEDFDSESRRGCFAINSAVESAGDDPEVKALVQRHFQRVEDALHTTIEEGQQSGEIDTREDARALARRVLSTHYGLRVLSKGQDDRQALTDIVDSTLRTL
ncbi:MULTISPECIES: TetR/AcrR family transcriptional regulator [Streptomyces]|uniref:TetR/AcrR family transcriptional regulator n=1 Tax=Streptomyces TaxID=1883 RepID=UPI00287FA479|nr:TetR/AcrR family transcriptional regulator [Streptomyces sp. CGMCC 4.1456]WNF62129.1 TetR/AcrR family transcriptional regulator [Streptomyces sp. CGMCC 4.1456]